MKKITAVVNQKGGVAKTTTAVNLSYELSNLGKKVLLIDLDPQSSATSSLFGNEEFQNSIYDLLLSKCSVEDMILNSVEFNIDLIPSDIMLSGIDLQISQQVGREKILHHKIKHLDYDIILIDTPPSLGLLTVNALTACNDVLITICPEYFSLKGISLLENTINMVKENLDTSIELFGAVVTRYRDRVITKDAYDIIKQYFEKKLFDTIIPDNIKIEEAHNLHKPVSKYDPSCKGATSYKQLAEEFLEKWQNQKSTTHSFQKQTI